VDHAGAVVKSSVKVVATASTAALNGLRKVQSVGGGPWKSVARQYPPSSTPTQPTPAAAVTALGKQCKPQLLPNDGAPVCSVNQPQYM